jgi:CBS domain-containing protein
MTETRPAPSASDFMTRHVACVSPQTSLADIIDFLERHDVSNAPVVNERDSRKLLVGFVSERDCLEFLANESFFGSPAPPQTAETIMRKHPVCVQPETELFTLASIFVNHGYRHLPVVKDGELLGIVSRRDILKAMNDYYQREIRDRDRVKHPPEVAEMIQQRLIVTSR